MDMTQADDGALSIYNFFQPKFLIEILLIIHHKDVAGVWQAEKV